MNGRSAYDAINTRSNIDRYKSIQLRST